METRWFTDYQPSTRWPHYTRAIAREIMESPFTPLGQKFVWDAGLIHGAAEGSCRAGIYEIDEYDPITPEVFGFFGGYLYINLSNLRMQGVRNPLLTVEQVDFFVFGDRLAAPPYVAHADDAKPHFAPKIAEHMKWLGATNEWPELSGDRARVDAVRSARPDLTLASDGDLLERARSTLPDLVWGYSQHSLASNSSYACLAILDEVAEAVGDRTIPMRLVAGLGDLYSATPTYALWALSRIVRDSQQLTTAFDAGVVGLLSRLARTESDDVRMFIAEWEDFVHEYGSRGPNEWDLGSETWETNPELALSLVDRIRHQSEDKSPRRRSEIATGERRALTEQIRQKLASTKSRPGRTGSAKFFEVAVAASNFMVFRERTKRNLIKTIHESRMAFRELGRRHATTGTIADPFDVFMLTDEELDDFVADPECFAGVLTARHEQWLRLAEIEPPFTITDGHVPPLRSWPPKRPERLSACSPGSVLRGVAASPGVAEGRARVILDPADPVAVDPGDILIAANTQPGWSPLLMTAAGAIVDVGGPISHAVIVSRELGLPCVTSVKGATTRIPNGAMIEVDGTYGRVTVKELP